MIDILGIILLVLIIGPNELRITVLKILGAIAVFFLFAYLFVEHPVIFAILIVVSVGITVWDALR